MEGLKAKTLNSAKWSLLEKAINIGFEFGVGIILARLLLPSDFGTVAIISVIISFSLTFVNSGFSQSLIRDTDVGSRDYSTIFIFNLGVGMIFYILIFFLANKISIFYQDSDLELYIKVLGLSIFISSFALIQRVTYTREMNFKMMSKISMVSSTLSGIVALGLAVSGFGIWSLIAKSLFREVIQTCLFWFNGKWRPSILFSKLILRKHFRYGSNFLFSAIIGQVYNNILALTIGKIFSLQTLGYYNRAQLFSNTISENLGGVLTGVSFPALAKVQNEKEKFVAGVRMLLKQALYIIGILMIFLFFTSKTLIPLLLGQQWVETGIYLQYLCVIGYFGMLNSILVNSISVTGRSNVYLYFQILALVFNLISLTVGYFYGIESMLMVLILLYFVCYIIISIIFQVYFEYSLKDQFYDFRIILFIQLVMIIIGVFFLMFETSGLLLMLMVFLQLLSVIWLSYLLKIKEFLILKSLLSK